MDKREFAKKYLDIFETKQGEGLSDIITHDISFNGPFVKADGAQEFVEAMQKWIQVKKNYHIQKIFIDGDDICMMYVVDVITPGTNVKLSIPMTDWITLTAGKITKEQVFFDPRGWLKAMGR